MSFINKKIEFESMTARLQKTAFLKHSRDVAEIGLFFYGAIGTLIGITQPLPREGAI